MADSDDRHRPVSTASGLQQNLGEEPRSFKASAAQCPTVGWPPTRTSPDWHVCSTCWSTTGQRSVPAGVSGGDPRPSHARCGLRLSRLVVRGRARCDSHTVPTTAPRLWQSRGSAIGIRKAAGGDPQPLDHELTHFGDIQGRLVSWSQRPEAQEHGVQGFEQLAGVNTGCASAAAGTSSVMTCT